MYINTLTHTINLKYLKHNKKYRFIFYKTVLPFNFIKIYEHHLEKYFSFLVWIEYFAFTEHLNLLQTKYMVYTDFLHIQIPILKIFITTLNLICRINDYILLNYAAKTLQKFIVN